MAVNPYLNFNGNCREAVMFYTKVFGTEQPRILCFGDMPSDPNWPMPEEAKKLVAHTQLQILGSTLMFSDIFPGMPFSQGSQIGLTVMFDSQDQLRVCFEQLKEGAHVEMELQQTEWSSCYGALVDQFGISWQLNMQQECK